MEPKIRLQEQIEYLNASFDASEARLKKERKDAIDRLWKLHIEAGLLKQDLGL